jgi:hypothetical protein
MAEVGLLFSLTERMVSMLRIPEMSHVAPSLLRQGFVRIQNYDGRATRLLQESFSALIAIYGVEKLRNFTYEIEKRPDGKFEPDDGFLDVGGVSGGGIVKDKKRMFHFRANLFSYIEYTTARYKFDDAFCRDLNKFLQLCQVVYQYHRDIAQILLRESDKVLCLESSFEEAFVQSLQFPASTSRSVLRLLDYPAHGGEIKAKVHYDRSFLTLHAGDVGGELFIRHRDGSEEVVSPQEGEIIAFWGMKAQIFGMKSKHLICPVAHGVRGKPQEVRKAIVSFWHINEVLFDAPKVLY